MQQPPSNDLVDSDFLMSLLTPFPRIDYFLNGTKGYINNVLVDYSETSLTKIFSKPGGFIANYGDGTFEESFVEYAYTGETISTEDGLETITGSRQESSKIIITYKLKEK